MFESWVIMYNGLPLITAYTHQYIEFHDVDRILSQNMLLIYSLACSYGKFWVVPQESLISMDTQMLT